MAADYWCLSLKQIWIKVDITIMKKNIKFVTFSCEKKRVHIYDLAFLHFFLISREGMEVLGQG